MNKLLYILSFVALLYLVNNVSATDAGNYASNRSQMIDSVRRYISRVEPTSEYNVNISCPQQPTKNTTYVQYCSILIGEFTTKPQYKQVACTYNAQLSEYVCRSE